MDSELDVGSRSRRKTCAAAPKASFDVKSVNTIVVVRCYDLTLQLRP